jgi:hypothetical protein
MVTPLRHHQPLRGEAGHLSNQNREVLSSHLKGGTKETADARLDDPTKRWKYNPADVDERAYWDDYQQAYSDALGKCNTEAAPWYAVPADRRWYRNWAVTRILTEQLEEMALTWPTPTGWDLQEERARLAAES